MSSTCLEPLPQQFEHPPVQDAPLDQSHEFVVLDAPEVVVNVRVEDVIASSGAPIRKVSNACVAFRFGRNPYEDG